MIELQCLNRILNDGNDKFFIDNGIDESYFTKFKEEYKFIEKYYNEYGVMPSPETILSNKGENNTPLNMEFFDVNDSDRYLVNTLKEERTFNKSVTIIKRASDLLATGQSEDAVNLLQRETTILSEETGKGGTDIVQDQTRLDILKDKKNGKTSVIRTGLAELDDLIYGWLPGEELATVVARTGNGKEQPLSSKVLTPNGWATMGSLKVGDKVFSANGEITNITAIFPQGIKDVYRIHLDDGTYVESGLEHLWLVQTWNDRKNNKPARTMTLNKMITEGVIKNGVRNFSIPLISPINFTNELSNELDPYLLGATISNEEESIIPNDYMYASLENRIALLRGLCDIGGSISTKNNHIIVYKTPSLNLAKQVVELINSLGGKVKLTPKKRKDYNSKIFYFVYFSINICPFSDREKFKKETWLSNKDCNKYITNIEKVRQEECQCIMVDNPSHTYITDNYTTTHNTWILVYFLVAAWKQGKRVGMYSGEMTADRIGYRFDTIVNNFSNRELVRGTIEDCSAYEKYLNDLKKENPFYVITPNDLGGRATVSQLVNFAKRNKLDILGIDQYSLMRDEKAGKNSSTREQLEHISADLFQASIKLGIPIIVLSQANRGGVKDEKQGGGTPDIENIYGADAIAQNATKVLSIRQTGAGVEISVKKNRDDKFGDTLCYRWDIDTGTIAFIPSAKEDPDKATVVKKEFKDSKELF